MDDKSIVFHTNIYKREIWRYCLGEPRFGELSILYWEGTVHLSLEWLINRLESCLWLRKGNNIIVKECLNAVNYF